MSFIKIQFTWVSSFKFFTQINIFRRSRRVCLLLKQLNQTVLIDQNERPSYLQQKTIVLNTPIVLQNKVSPLCPISPKYTVVFYFLGKYRLVWAGI